MQKIVEVSIKDSDYEIIFTHARNPGFMGEDLFGRCDMFNHLIFIDHNYKNWKETLRHEITHAVIFEYGFERTEWDEENVVLFISKYYPIIDKIFKEVVELYDYQTTN